MCIWYDLVSIVRSNRDRVSYVTYDHQGQAPSPLPLTTWHESHTQYLDGLGFPD